MKLNKIVNFILIAIGLILGSAGVLLVIGSVDPFDQGVITFGKFICQEFAGLLLIAGAFAVYVIREIFKYQHMN